jgi:ferredoxin
MKLLCRIFGHKWRNCGDGITLTVNPPINIFGERCVRCGRCQKVHEQRGVRTIMSA